MTIQEIIIRETNCVIHWLALSTISTTGGWSHISWARGTVFKVWGPVTTCFEVRGGGANLAVFPLWLFLELSDYWTFLESLLSSRVMFKNFKPLISTFLQLSLIAHAGSTTRSLQIVILKSQGVLPYITYTGMCCPSGSWFEAPELEWGTISEAFSRTGYNISNAWKLQFCKQPFEIIQEQIAVKNMVQCINKQTVVLLLHPMF